MNEELKTKFENKIKELSNKKYDLTIHTKRFNLMKKNYELNLLEQSNLKFFMDCLEDNSKFDKILNKMIDVVRMIDLFPEESKDLKEKLFALDVNGFEITNDFGEIHEKIKNNEELLGGFEVIREVNQKKQKISDDMAVEVENLAFSFDMKTPLVRKAIDIQFKVDHKDCSKAVELDAYNNELDRNRLIIDYLN